MEHRVGGDVEVGAGDPHVLQLPGGAVVPQGDQGGLLHHPLHPAAVGRTAHRADAVGIQHHRLAQPVGAADDGEVIEQGAGGGGVLQQAAPTGEQGVAPAQGGENLPHPEPGDGLQTILPPGELRVVGQGSDGDVVAGLVDGLLNGLQNGIVPGVGKAVVAAHHHMEGAAHLVVYRQAVVGHAVDGVALLHHPAAIVPQVFCLVGGEGQGPQQVGLELLRGGHRVGAAAEVGVHCLV